MLDTWRGAHDVLAMLTTLAKLPWLYPTCYGHLVDGPGGVVEVGEGVRGRVEVELVEQREDEDPQPDDAHEHRVGAQVEHLVRSRVRGRGRGRGRVGVG